MTTGYLDFDGDTYEPEHDGARLTSQYQRVFELMRDGRWRTLAEIARVVVGTETAVSARLRDARKPKFGGHTVERKRGDAGLWSYRLLVRQAEVA